MSEQEYRVERDSMGEVRVRRMRCMARKRSAVENFPISDLRFRAA